MPLGLKLTYTSHRDEDGRGAQRPRSESAKKSARARAREKEHERESETRRDFVADIRDAIDDASAQETLTMTQILGRRRARGHTEVPSARSRHCLHSPALGLRRERTGGVQKVRERASNRPPESREALFPSLFSA